MKENIMKQIKNFFNKIKYKIRSILWGKNR